MDRAEGALRVAERALDAARKVSKQISDLPTAKVLASFLLDAKGDLIVIYGDGSQETVGRVVGNDGASVLDASIDGNGSLVLRLSDNRTVNAGVVKGDPGEIGPPGRAITSAKVNNQGHLMLTYSDGRTDDAGLVVLEGKQGEPGLGIQSARLSDGKLSLKFTDESVVDLGDIRGEQGEHGEQGITGKQGPRGERGLAGRDGVGADGKPGKAGPPGPPGKDADVAIGQMLDAGLSLNNLGQVVQVELVINGKTLHVLALEG